MVNIKVATVMLLLALVVVAVNADHDGHQHHRRVFPQAGLTQCVTICGSGVTACMLDCYQPLVDLDPVALPICLLKCTNDAVVCASSCPLTGNNV